MSEREFLKEKDLLLNSIEKNTAKHWENYYSNVPIEYIFEDLVIDINEIKRLTEENKELKKQIEYLRRSIERKEETITELERERVSYVNEYVGKLKKQLEEANEKILLLQASEPMLEYKKALEENHQKEFIEWLMNEANINPYDISDYIYEDIINTILCTH